MPAASVTRARGGRGVKMALLQIGSPHSPITS